MPKHRWLCGLQRGRDALNAIIINRKPITMPVIVEIINSKLLDFYRRRERRISARIAGVAPLNKGVVHTYMTQEHNGHSAEMFKEYPDIITIIDLQAMLHIGRNAAYKLLQDNSIVSIRVGKKYIIPKASVASFITEGVQK